MIVYYEEISKIRSHKKLHLYGDIRVPLDYDELSTLQKTHVLEDHFINPLKKITGCDFSYSHGFAFKLLQCMECIAKFKTEKEKFFFKLVMDAHIKANKYENIS